MVLEKTLESPLDCKEIQPVHSKGDQSWVFFGRTDAKAEMPILWPPNTKNWLILKRPWCWERVKAGGEGDDRGQDDCMASLTQWTWVWVNSRSWRWTGRPGVLQSMGISKSQTRPSDWTELNWNPWCLIEEHLERYMCRGDEEVLADFSILISNIHLHQASSLEWGLLTVVLGCLIA